MQKNIRTAKFKKTSTIDRSKVKIIVNINSNGLISIPKKIRNELGLINDSKIPVYFSGNQLIIKANENLQLIDRARKLQQKMGIGKKYKKFIGYQNARNNLTTDEILDEIGGMR